MGFLTVGDARLPQSGRCRASSEWDEAGNRPFTIIAKVSASLIKKNINVFGAVASRLDPGAADVLVVHLVPVVVLVPQLGEVVPPVQAPEVVHRPQQPVLHGRLAGLGRKGQVLVELHDGVDLLAGVVALLEARQVQNQVLGQSVQESRLDELRLLPTFLADQILDVLGAHLLLDQLHEADFALGGSVGVGHRLGRGRERQRQALIPFELVLDVFGGALELPDQFGREQLDYGAALQLPHLTDEILVVLLQIEALVVVEGVEGPLGLPLGVLGVEQLEEADEELLGVLLVVALHDLDMLFDCQFELLVVPGALGVLELEEEPGDGAPALGEGVWQN